MMNNIAKSLRTFSLRKSSISMPAMIIVIVCLAFTIYTALKATLGKGINRASKLTLAKGNPCHSKKVKAIVSDLIHDRPMNHQNYKHIKKMNLDTDSSSGAVDVFSFSVEDKDYEAWAVYRHGGKAVLVCEATSYYDVKKYIREESLKNISITSKAIYKSKAEAETKVILVKESPDMKTDEAVRKSGLLRDREKCKTAAESLARLAVNFIFTAPSNPIKYPEICKLFRKMRQDFDNKSIDIAQCGFTADRLLGAEYLTVSKDKQGFAKVNVLSASKQMYSVPKTIFRGKPYQAMILNQAMILTLFPYNVEDIIKTVEKESSVPLSLDDKKFLKEIAESAKLLI